ncbi:hypothetical protein M9H77_03349 [Catharanthus roseus]|uniref:Uncharacterized protein n=1 Tax=Catharanthus roseus TaxID=4058 RepID=A0ACC0CBH1_CATRO|nr:hypothetical protein M9H77_03349 [Catharanthus roseus]
MFDELLAFGFASRLQANSLKFNIYLAGILDFEKSLTMDYTGFQARNLPCRYLGIPFLGVYLKLVDHAPLSDKVTKTLLAWTGLNMSYACRLEVITSAVQGILSFWLGIFLCRQWLWTELQAYAEDFYGDIILQDEGTVGASIDRVLDCVTGDTFQTTTAYTYFTLARPKQSWAKIVWNPTFPPKFSFTIWLNVLGRLPTMDKLKFLEVYRTCNLCKQNEGTLSHLFFTCPFTGDKWMAVREWDGLRKRMTTMQSYLKWLNRDYRGTSWTCNFKKLSFAATLYYVWECRNKVAFESYIPDWNYIVSKIKI